MDSDQIQKVDSLFGHNTHNKSIFASDTGLTINQTFTVENTKKVTCAYQTNMVCVRKGFCFVRLI